MNVLSLFDGMSGGQLALQRAGIAYDNYFSSEIDKYAIKIAQKNFPNTIQLGDVIRWHDWHLPEIDLLIGGSPCQGFSNAGEGLNFDDPRSRLLFEFLNCLKYFKPKYFLLENVKMKKEWKDKISDLIGCDPIEINSALVSAQSRKRLYWTNIPNIEQPEDKGLILRDILIDSGEVCGRVVGRRIKDGKRADYDYSIKPMQMFEPREDNKSGALTTVQKDNMICIEVGKADVNGHDILKRVYSPSGKSPAFNSMNGGNRQPKIVTNIYPSKGQNGNIYDVNGKSPTLSAGEGISGNGIGSNNSPKIITSAFIPEDDRPKGNYLPRERVISIEGKMRAVTNQINQNPFIDDNLYWRKLTPIECERLQTIPDNYTEGVSDTQRYKMIGNGWTVDVIAHIFSFLPDNWKIQN